MQASMNLASVSELACTPEEIVVNDGTRLVDEVREKGLKHYKETKAT